MKTKQILNLLFIPTLLVGFIVSTLLAGSVSADSFATYAQCADFSTEVTMSAKTKKISGIDAKVVTIACKSGSSIKYGSGNLNKTKKRIQLTYECPGEEKPVPNTNDGKVTVYCQKVTNPSPDHPGTTPTTSKPKVTDKVVKSINDTNDENTDDEGELSDPIAGSGCGGVKTAIIKCDQDNSGGVENNGVWGLLMIVLNILTAGVGIVAVGGIVYGAILYTTAEDKADQVKKATDIITNVVIGLIAFALMWALLNFIVPGGVFN